MTIIKKDRTKADIDLEMARKQASEYAMALDLLAKITHSGSENEAVENILELFTMLFSPQKLSYVSLKDGKPEQIYSSSLSEDDDAATKNRLANFAEKYAWTESAKGFLLKINHKGNPLGILEVDEICFPDVCGLTIENARKYQQIKNNEDRLRQEKEKLEEALAKVKKLSGLLPICASCKKIRDDNGYWNQIESYIRDHSEAEFSHSICPECAPKLYPELFEGEETDSELDRIRDDILDIDAFLDNQ